jgi:hypothetical protein
MKRISLSGIWNCRRRVYCVEAPLEAVLELVKTERVSRWASWVVGAESREGSGLAELKLLMDQRTMQFSLAALESIRSP